MALRSMGVYLLTGTALRSQTRTAYHLAEMERLAAESASLSLLAGAELESSLEMQGKAAVDSEEGLALQTESAELELDAARETGKAAAEKAMGDGYAEQAEALHEKSAKDMAESEAAVADAEELEVQSGVLHTQAAEDRAAAALDEEKSVALLEQSARAGEVAAGAEERAAEYEAVALRREGQSIKDGEALLRTEAGALEDAEAMAACAPIPILDVFCEAIGTVVEAGYQGIAAFEGAKSAVETMSAAAAQRKEHAELVMAIEEQEEAARFALEAERFQGLADEAVAKAIAEEGESDGASVEAGEAELLGEEKLEESEREEALAVLDEEKASEEYAKAARDESIALEEESSAVASQVESEELLAESTSEEFEALAEEFDGETKEEEAGKMMKQSIGQGIHALGLVLHATVTAVLVVYVIFMRGLLNVALPGVVRILNGESSLTTATVLARACGFVVHIAIVIGSIASMQVSLSNLEDIPAPLRVKALFYLAVVAGVIEALTIHSLSAACCCYAKGMDARTTLATSIEAFLSNLVHLVPVVMMELLCVMVLFGPGIFHQSFFLSLNPIWIWGAFALLVGTFVLIRIMGKEKPKMAPDTTSVGDEESEFLFASPSTNPQNERSDVAKEYGSMEDVSLSSTDDDGPSSAIISSASDATAPGCFGKCRETVYRYFEGLRLSSDLLLLTLMAMLLWHCLPVLKVLQPVAKTFFGAINAYVSMPVLVAAVALAVTIVHFIFVH